MLSDSIVAHYVPNNSSQQEPPVMQVAPHRRKCSSLTPEREEQQIEQLSSVSKTARRDMRYQNRLSVTVYD